jgi:hypothetical protein
MVNKPGIALMISLPRYATEDDESDEGGDRWQLSPADAQRYARKGKDEKASPDDVGYTDEAPHCGICSMFRAPSACTAVKGKIAASGYCKLFEAKDEDGGGGEGRDEYCAGGRTKRRHETRGEDW